MKTSRITEAVQSAVAGRSQDLRDGSARLRDDLRALMRDAEALLRDIGGASRDGMGAARSQLEGTLADVRGRMADKQEAARTQVSRAMYATGDYVSANPVKAVAIAAAVGAVLAWFLTRGGDDVYDMDDGGAEDGYDGRFDRRD